MPRVIIFHDNEDAEALRSEIPNLATGDTGETKEYINPNKTGKGRAMCLDFEQATEYMQVNGENGIYSGKQ